MPKGSLQPILGHVVMMLLNPHGAVLLQVHVKLLRNLTNLHLHGVSPPVTADNLNSLFSALPALQLPCIAKVCRAVNQLLAAVCLLQRACVMPV